MFSPCNNPTLKMEAEYSLKSWHLYTVMHNRISQRHPLCSDWSPRGSHTTVAIITKPYPTVFLCLAYEEPFGHQECVPHTEHSQVTAVANITSVWPTLPHYSYSVRFSIPLSVWLESILL